MPLQNGIGFRARNPEALGKGSVGYLPLPIQFNDRCLLCRRVRVTGESSEMTLDVIWQLEGDRGHDYALRYEDRKVNASLWL